MTTVRVFSGNGMAGSLGELLPAFERSHGCRVEVHYNPAQVLLREIKSGDIGDLALLGGSAMDQLMADGTITASTVRVLTRNGIGVGVAKGAPKPDLSSVEHFKQALLNARCVAYTSEGASGIYFNSLIEKLGIADAVRAKAKTRAGGLIAEFVVSGDADLAVQQTPEILAVAGVDYAGPLPDEVQNIAVGRGGIFSAAKEPPLAQALLDFLQTPAAAQVYRVRGLTPQFG